MIEKGSARSDPVVFGLVCRSCPRQRSTLPPRVVFSIYAPAMSDTSLDSLLSRISGQDSQSNPKAIANALAVVVKREDGAQILRSNLQNGSDPLQAIPPAAMTLPYLYILSVFNLSHTTLQLTNMSYDESCIP